MPRYEYLQHMVSGEIFAVTLDDNERVTAATEEPISRRDLKPDPSDYANWTSADLEWFDDSHEAPVWRLISATEAMQLREYTT